MGTTATKLPKDQLSEYQELTFLTKQEILLAHKRFTELLDKNDRQQLSSRIAIDKIYFDDDGTLDQKDLEKLVNNLTGESADTRLTPEEMNQLINNILEESDIDKDGTVNLSEFQHVISRSPDFVSSFKIVL